MKLCWKASWSYVRDLCLGIAKTGAVILEIDGISLDISPQDLVQYMKNLFSEAFIASDGLELITLHNYPRPQEQCFHFYDFLLQSTLPSTQLVGSWEDLREDLDKFRRLVYKVQVESDLNIAVGELQAALEKHGLFDVITVTIYNGIWDAVIDMEKMAFVEVYSRDAVCPRAVLTSGSLLRLIIDYRDDWNSQQDVIKLIRSNTGLKELNISYLGQDVHYYIDHVVKMWHQSSSSLCLTLLDRMEDTQGWVIAQLARSRGDSEFRGNSSLDVLQADDDPTFEQEQQVSDNLVDIQFMSWDCEHISGQPSDYSASVLDMATEQHPSVLTLLTLDISQLSRTGLALVQNILGRSSLEHLHILCTSFNPTTSESIAQVLGSVQWLTLKSLILSGDHIDEWIKLWPSSSQAPQLMHLLIHGTGSKKQELSHSSVLFLHELVFMSPLQEFDLKNITLKDIHNRGLIRAGEDEL